MSVEQIKPRQSIETTKPSTKQKGTQKEIEEIFALTRTGKETREQRSKRNASLREKLSVASDEAVAYAASSLNMSDLIDKEFMKRLKKGRSFPLEPLFEYVNNLELYSGGIERRVEIDKLNLITDSVIRYTPTVPQEEIVNVLGNFMGEVIIMTHITYEMLSRRQDIEEITSRVVESTPGEDYKKNVAWRMELIKNRANRLKNNRKL